MSKQCLISNRWAACWRTLVVAVGVAVPVLAAVTLRSDEAPSLRSTSDWPAYRHDMQRSSVTDEKLAFPLQPAWRWTSARPPSPAWPSTARVLNQMTFDHAFQPVVAGGLVCFGSSSDDTLRALDAKTGEERWHFVAGGPIRFAPEIADGKLYVAADDGWVHCLELATGKPVWSFRAAPSDERLLGDGRMISRWPLRCGVLVDDGTAYVVAGMWPTEGVFIYALDAATGAVRWCHDTAGYPAPWEKFRDLAFFYSGMSPQGPLLASRDGLVVPAGRTMASALDRKTGQLLHLQPGRKGAGGGYALCVNGDTFTTYLGGKKGLPWIVGGTNIRRGGGGNKFGNVSQPAPILVPDREEGGNHEVLAGISMILSKDRFYARRAFQLALAGEILIAGERNAVAAYDARLTSREKKNEPGRYDPETQTELWRAPVNGLPYGLAVADGRLYVSTDRGEITCFAPGEGKGKGEGVQSSVFSKQEAGVGNSRFIPTLRRSGQDSKIADSKQPKTQNLKPETANFLKQAGMDVGYALVVGDTDGATAIALAQATDLRVVTVVSDAAAATALRERLLATTDLHGSRVHVFEAPKDGRLPFAQFFANAVIVASLPPDLSDVAIRAKSEALAEGGLSGKELYRVLRPCGGIMLFSGLSIAETGKLIEETGALESEIRAPHLPAVLRSALQAGKQTPTPTTDLSRRSPPMADEDGTPITGPAIIRGPLPGAADWDSPNLSDYHLKGPLRPLWFGGPGPMERYDRLTGYPTMTAAGGRYFYLVRGSLVAVDAYNGRKLWERPAPLEVRKAMIDGREELVPQDTTQGVSKEVNLAWRAQPSAIIALTADPTNVFLTLGKACFRGQGPACIRLDARTGVQRAIHGAVTSPAPAFSLATPQMWTIPVDVSPVDGSEREQTTSLAGQRPSRDVEHSATVALSAEADGLKLDLATQDPFVTTGDGWDLFFDFRPAAERFGLYDRGTFWVNVLPAGAGRESPSWLCLRGEACPDLVVTGAPQAGSTRTIVRLPWTNLAAVVQDRPKSFGFAAALRSKDEEGEAPVAKADKPALERKRAAQRAKPRVTYLFADELADSLNNGWATIALADGAAEVSASKAPAVLSEPLTQVPEKFRKSNIRLAYYLPDPEAQRRPRVHPLTGEVGPKKFIRGNGCGAIFSSAYLYYMRSSTVGVYDLLDDAGIWSFGGVRPSCGQNMLAAQGVLIVGDDLSACTCQYAFQTPFALAHAERRLSEDWRQFYDFPADNLVRTAALNLGAPGDRRDADGTLWLGFPRFAGGNGPLITPGGRGHGELNGIWPHNFPFSIKVSLQVEAVTNLGPYRFNADRTSIRNTDRPWIYASGYRGIQKATLPLDFRKPLISQAIGAPPAVDGKIEAAWGEPTLTLKNTKTQIHLRQDAQALYLAARCSAPPPDHNGKSRPLRKETKGEDAAVWDDDSVELFLADRQGTRVVHFGVSASGARFEALAGDGAATEDAKWRAPWTSAVATEGEGFVAEIAVPLTTLKAAGLDPAALAVNLQVNQRVDTA